MKVFEAKGKRPPRRALGTDSRGQALQLHDEKPKKLRLCYIYLEIFSVWERVFCNPGRILCIFC